ncbi:LysE family translocator [Thalassospira sp. TSL5-1]|uniref:LysE family translocator n=1 Tax=Thalassospira sp. TSL5-1 TaxID=1544451 RepID=UPI00093B4662|nr:LysE family translocator [Thalassospira sp. TSL5-1]OKH87623.1 lysine transporter LysE [Thalassospira sp. TSL5-1]
MIDLLTAYGPFLLAALLLNIAPGPDLAFVSAQAAAYGRKTGVMASLGVCSGAFVHVVFAAIGLSAILMTSALAFAIVKWVGVAYLAWLGWTTLYGTFCTSKQTVDGATPGLLAGDAEQDVAEPVIKGRHAPDAFHAWRRGVLIDVFNPKVALFFMAFLPQFVDPALGHQTLQFLALGTIVNLIGFIVETCVVLVVAMAANRLRQYFSKASSAGKWLHRALGAMFLALGARLALSERGV